MNAYGDHWLARAMRAAGNCNAAIVLDRLHFHQVRRWPTPVEWVFVKRENLVTDTALTDRTFKRALSHLTKLGLTEYSRKGTRRGASVRLRVTAKGTAEMATSGQSHFRDLGPNVDSGKPDLGPNVVSLVNKENLKKEESGESCVAVPSTHLGLGTLSKDSGKGKTLMTTVRELLSKSKIAKPEPSKIEKSSDLQAIWRSNHEARYPKVFMKPFTGKEAGTFSRLLKIAPSPAEAAMVIRKCVSRWPEFTNHVIAANASKLQPKHPSIVYIGYHLALALEFARSGNHSTTKVVKPVELSDVPIAGGYDTAQKPDDDVATLSDLTDEI